MATFLAVYRGDTVGSARLVAVSADPKLIADVSSRLLEAPPEADAPTPWRRRCSGVGAGRFASSSGRSQVLTEKPLISVAQAADLWGRSRTSTYESARRDELPGLVRFNGRLYVRRRVLMDWLAGQDGSPNGRPTD